MWILLKWTWEWDYVFKILILFSSDKYPAGRLLDCKIIFGDNILNEANLIWWWKLRRVYCPLSWVVIVLLGIVPKLTHFIFSLWYLQHRRVCWILWVSKTISLQPGRLLFSLLLWVSFLVESHPHCLIYYEPRKHPEVQVD